MSEKLMIASDIHGSAYYCKKMIDIFKLENCDRLILLGDLLYHGPRNDLPKEYNPKAVISMLNEISDKIICVRGNCDSEVDQMVLNFPILAEYALLFIDNKTLFLTHGHKFNPDNPPSIQKGDILFNGHTHIPEIKETNGIIYMNPGSVSLGKTNGRNTYIIYENSEFIIKDI